MIFPRSTHKRLSRTLLHKKSSSTSNDDASTRDGSRCGWTVHWTNRDNRDDESSSHTSTSSLSDSFSMDDSTSSDDDESRRGSSSNNKPLPRRSSLKVKTIHESLKNIRQIRERRPTTLVMNEGEDEQPPRRHGVVFGQVDIRYHERIESIPHDEIHLQLSRGPTIEFDWECVDSATFETLDNYEKTAAAACSITSSSKKSSSHFWLSREEREQVVRARRPAERKQRQKVRNFCPKRRTTRCGKSSKTNAFMVWWHVLLGITTSNTK